jgi:hypothetical protein
MPVTGDVKWDGSAAEFDGHSALGLVGRVGILQEHEALQGLPREGHDMTMGAGNIAALVCIIISIVFAIITNQATNALWWALLAIFAVLWWGVKAPWGK